jgi:hypothetical protein
MRELLEKRMTGMIIGLKQGSKTIAEALPVLNKLKASYPLIAEEYEKKYIAALQARTVKA